ncbi:MAG TPA: hypothetical protein VFP87_08675, partial [Chitinophagaceae bacterium]|nr:hypothetical protein [Chitinophagaceae bacterium]
MIDFRFQISDFGFCAIHNQESEIILRAANLLQRKEKKNLLLKNQAVFCELEITEVDLGDQPDLLPQPIAHVLAGYFLYCMKNKLPNQLLA